MKLKAIAAAAGLAAAVNAQALVTTPATTGGSEFIFMISNGLDGSEHKTAYILDLGVTRASFNFTQPQSWTLATTFTNVFLNASEWDEDGSCTVGNGLICGDRPTADSGWFSSVLGWGVIAAELDGSGDSWVLSTYSATNNSTLLPDGVTPGFIDEGLGDPVYTGASVLNDAIQMPDDDPGTAGTQDVQRQINEIPNHSSAGNNSALVEINGVNTGSGAITSLQLNNAGAVGNSAERQRYGGNAMNNYMATRLFDGFGAQASVLRPSATTDEIVTMYLFEEGFNTTGEIVGVPVGYWYLDFSGIDSTNPAPGTFNSPAGNVILRYQPVPVPAAVWLLASALVGMAGISRRSRTRG